VKSSAWHNYIIEHARYYSQKFKQDFDEFDQSILIKRYTSP
jgi:hypothetical protein